MAAAARIFLFLNLAFGLFALFAAAGRGNDFALFATSITMTLSVGFIGVMAAIDRLRRDIVQSRPALPASALYAGSAVNRDAEV